METSTITKSQKNPSGLGMGLLSLPPTLPPSTGHTPWHQSSYPTVSCLVLALVVPDLWAAIRFSPNTQLIVSRLLQKLVISPFSSCIVC